MRISITDSPVAPHPPDLNVLWCKYALCAPALLNSCSSASSNSPSGTSTSTPSESRFHSSSGSLPGSSTNRTRSRSLSIRAIAVSEATRAHQICHSLETPPGDFLDDGLARSGCSTLADVGEQSQRKKDRVRYGCYLCGRPFTPDLPPTKDHVVPESWFPRPLPANVPTRKACRGCNGSLSEREERVRNLLARMHAQEPAALEEVFGRATRSSRQPNVVGGTLWRLDSGLLAPADLAAFDAEDIQAVFNKITRGLFFIEYGYPLGIDLPVKAIPLSTESAERVTRLVLGEWKRRVRWVGEALAWTNAVDDESPEHGLWLYLPLHSAVTAVFTGKATTLPLPSPARHATLRR